VAFAEVEARAPEPEPAPAPVAVAEFKPTVAVTEPGTFAHRMAMAGLKPIVIAKKPVPGSEEPKREGLTAKLLGKLFGKK
jgi:hypothetical protein